MRSSLTTSISFAAIFMVGLMAGLMLGTGMDQYTHRLLSASAWVTEHQVMDALFRRALPPMWNLTMLLLALAAFLSKGRARWLFAAAAGIFVISLLVTILVEVPMNRSIEIWNAQIPPADWAEVRDRWLRFHLARTTGGLVAFVLAIFALLQRAKPMRSQADF